MNNNIASNQSAPQTSNKVESDRLNTILDARLWIAFSDLPPAAQKIYIFLLERSEPGTIQEFDKEDFDDYCQKRKIKPLSNAWFVNCVKLLAKKERIKIRRKYKGCIGYQVEAFLPEDPAASGLEVEQ